jgi:hypothetical protein
MAATYSLPEWTTGGYVNDDRAQLFNGNFLGQQDGPVWLMRGKVPKEGLALTVKAVKVLPKVLHLHVKLQRQAINVVLVIASAAIAKTGLSSWCWQCAALQSAKSTQRQMQCT